MAHVVRRWADQLHVGQRRNLGPAVLGDPRDGRAHHVQQRHRLRAAVLAALPGQHEQVLAVTAHPGGEVIDPEQQFQLRGVLLVALQLFHGQEQRLHQREVAHRQAGQHPVPGRVRGRVLGGGTGGDRRAAVVGPEGGRVFLGGAVGIEPLVDLLRCHLSQTRPGGGPGDPGVFRAISRDLRRSARCRGRCPAPGSRGPRVPGCRGTRGPGVPGQPFGELRTPGCLREARGRLCRGRVRAARWRPPAQQPADRPPAALPAPALDLVRGVRAKGVRARHGVRARGVRARHGVRARGVPAHHGGREIRRVSNRMRRVVASGRSGRRVRHDGISLRGDRGTARQGVRGGACLGGR